MATARMYVDTHTHLDLHDELSVAEQLDAARAAGVTTVITVGTDVASSTQVVATAAAHDDVWAVVGIHPNDADDATDEALAAIDALAVEPRVVGIGETGLDYYRDWAHKEAQARSFRAHIAMAKRHDLALVIHCRDTAHGGVAGDAWRDVLRILEAEGAPARTIMHCFSGDLSITKACVSAAYFMSFAGNVTYKNADALRMAAASAPLGLILTETDAPFLAPVPVRGQKNQAANVVHTLACLAEVRGEDPDELAAAVNANARRAFALPAADGVAA